MRRKVTKALRAPFTIFLGVVTALLTVASCNKSPTAPLLVAAEDLFLPGSANATRALNGTTLTFTGGAGAVDPTRAGQDMTMSFVSPNLTNQIATINISGSTATSEMAYGSCHFIIKTSNFADNSALAVGKTVVVNPCEMKITTKGLVANGGEQLTRVSMTLGTQLGAGSIKITITPDGIVKSGSSQLANLSLVPATGGT